VSLARSSHPRQHRTITDPRDGEPCAVQFHRQRIAGFSVPLAEQRSGAIAGKGDQMPAMPEDSQVC